MFGTEFGKTAHIAVDNPKEPVDEAAVKQAMAQIIAADVFTSASGRYVAAKSIPPLGNPNEKANCLFDMLPLK